MTYGKTLLGIGVSVAFLALVFWRVDLGAFIRALQGATYWLILPAAAIYFASFWLRALRWRVLLGPVGIVSLRRAYSVTMIGYAVNNVIPLRVGEVVRAMLLRRRPGLDPAASLATIAVERILDGVTLLSWLGIGALSLTSTWELSPTFRLLAQGAALIFGGSAVVMVPLVLYPEFTHRVSFVLFRVLPPRLRGGASELVRRFLEGFASLRSARILVLLILASQVIWGAEFLVYWVIAEALAMHVSPIALAVVVAVSNLATSIPSSSGGIGPFELAAKETLVLSGVGISLATAYAILIHLTLLVPVTIAGAILFAAEGVSPRLLTGPRDATGTQEVSVQ